MGIAIQVENISKQYRLGEIGTGTISHDLNRLWAKMRGKPDPFLKIGESNDRSTKGNSDYVWALKDINFDIQQGDAVGIIGRNGAGKSTLLKILSRTTSPTTGSVKVRGRIASLLEVGTGFQPELTGRENIYQNGAILGMRKAEITRKMDEIIDFSGCGRYIDTPVKRYSSGMYVRLAFAVAAHLESEILVVDEVLAVGDAEFQKKCLGKMGDISKGEGRTVIFVSHNLAAVKSLCNVGILMEKGKIAHLGAINNIIEKYFIDDYSGEANGVRNGLKKINSIGFFKEWNLINLVNRHSDYTREIFVFNFKFDLKVPLKKIELGFVLRDFVGNIVFGCNSRDNGGDYISLESGEYNFRFEIRLPIKYGSYEVDIALVSENEIVDQWVSEKKLSIISKFDSVLPDNWTGILQELPSFKYEIIN